MAVEDQDTFEAEELTAGHDTVARRLMTLQGGLRRVEEVARPLVVDLAAAEAGPPAASTLAPTGTPVPASTTGPTESIPAHGPSPTTAAALPPPSIPARPTLWQSFRAWWRQEAAARAEARAARNAAAAAMRAKDVQTSLPPAPADQAQAVRSMMALTEERFQSLGLRSDRLHDELVGISRTLGDLRGAVGSGAGRRAASTATGAVDDLQDRFDALLLALAEEFRRRGDETDRRLAEQLTLQNAELATLLEDALIRIRASIPDEFDRVRAEIPAAVERAVVASLPPLPTPEPPGAFVIPPAPSAVDEATLDRKLSELLVAMNRNTDRLADALHRGMFGLEQQIARRRQAAEAPKPPSG